MNEKNIKKPSEFLKQNKIILSKQKSYVWKKLEEMDQLFILKDDKNNKNKNNKFIIGIFLLIIISFVLISSTINLIDGYSNKKYIDNQKNIVCFENGYKSYEYYNNNNYCVDSEGNMIKVKFFVKKDRTVKIINN